IGLSAFLMSAAGFSLLTLLASDLTSSSSASFSASSNCLRNSPAIWRILAVVLPNVRSMRGKSLGPTTTIITIAITSISVQPTSSMVRASAKSGRRARQHLGGLGRLRLGGLHRLVGAMFHRLGRLARFRFVLVRHALLEALDALGHVAHQLRNLAAAEQEQHDDQHDQPVPDGKT